MRVTLACLPLALASLLPAATPAAPTSELAALRRLPIRFEPAAARVAGSSRVFEAHGIDYRMAVAPTGGYIQLRRNDGRTDQLAFVVEGANASASVTPSGALSGVSNYLTGGDRSQWRTNVPGYRRITYTGVLPDVDLTWYGNGGKLEFDFIVQPGGDPSSIRVRYTGQEKLTLDEDGNLVIHTASSSITQKAPAVYQREGESMRLVAARYELRGDGVIGYQVAAYDKTRPLVIDPVLVYAGYFGGDLVDSVSAVARDSRGRIYLAGTSQSSELPVTDSGVQGGQRGSSDGFVVIVDPSRTDEDQVVYATYLGGGGADQITGMGLDSRNRIFLTGNTQSADFPMSQYPYQGANRGGGECFFTVLDPAQEGAAGLVYSTYFGGEKLDWANDIAVRPDGTAAVIGYTDSTDFPRVGSSNQGASAGARDGFVAYFDVFQTLAWTTYLGGARTDYARGGAFASDGTLFVTGSTMSGDFPTTEDAFRPEANGGGDAFLRKYAADGTLAYSTYIGDGGLEEGTAVASINPNRVVVTGYTMSDNFPLVGAPVSPRRGDTDVFVMALDLTKPGPEQATFSTLIGGSETEIPYRIGIDLGGQAVITGYTASVDFPLTSLAIQNSYGGGSTDAFVARVNLNQQGTSALTYSSYIGGGGRDIGYSALREPNGRFVVGGQTGSRHIIASENAATPYQPGFGDGFVVIIAP